jgi:uncharacterized damage-inducible protein DinB
LTPERVRNILVAMTPDQAKIIADYLLPHYEHEYKTTRKVLAAVPADNTSYKPSERCMSGIDLATHIAAAEAFFLRGVLNGTFEWKQPECKTPAESLAYYEQNVPDLINQLKDVPGDKLAKEISFGPFTLPAVDFLTLGLKHSVHHRGQLSAYLRPMGGKVPGIYGPSADDKAEAAAK